MVSPWVWVLNTAFRKWGHFLAEARYYYGLGNIYGSSKRDYFGKSNYGQIVFKVSYLFDITQYQECEEIEITSQSIVMEK